MAEIRTQGRNVAGRLLLPRVRVQFQTPSEVLWGLAETLNRGWMVIPSGSTVRVGAQVEVAFEFPGRDKPVTTPGIVLASWEKRGLPGKMALIGLEIMTGEAKAHINAIVKGYRRRGRLPADRTVAAQRRRRALPLAG